MIREFSAHFDASGSIQKHRFITVAGCVSTVKKWVRFEGEWNKILSDDGLPVGTIFHMTDFAGCRGIYSIYKKNPTKKAELIANLVECVRRNVNKAISVGISPYHFQRLDQQYELSETYGHEYPFCGIMCIQKTLQWKAKAAKPDSLKIEFFFEHGDQYQNELTFHAQAMFGITPGYKTKTEMTQFQPCDMIAWKNRLALTVASEQGITGSKAALESIQRSIAVIESIPNDFGVFGRTELNALLNMGGIRRRANSGMMKP